MYMNYQLASTLYSVELTPAHCLRSHESHHWHYIAPSLFSLLRFIKKVTDFQQNLSYLKVTLR